MLITIAYCFATLNLIEFNYINLIFEQINQKINKFS